ncbi:DHH family phosphoesterase [Paenibacillus sp. J2TS4]|uniref:DHH family phosphoesterase n=1 Tax=Paenibacillus sp. J2TS4 TaxID=2807194 RepID=UPI001AFFDB10|nr:DHH family phosphoesterase [Paenibacillus sp. J2TS4]GIP36000.1 cyclic-di-AMP phosphodiesterase GdpP [Paenibacillus sp. J2TS4]
MPRFLFKRWHGLHMIWTLVLVLILIGVLLYYQWLVGLIALVPLAGLMLYSWKAEKAFRKDLYVYLSTLSHRIKKAGNEVFNQLPIGIILYNEEEMIEWHNPFISVMLEKESVIGEPLLELFPMLKDKEGEFAIELGSSTYQVTMKTSDKLIYLEDVTNQLALEQKYEEEKIAIGIVMLDNLEEATQGMDDQTRSVVQAKITGAINDWATRHALLLRRTSSDRFLIIMTQKSLRKLEHGRFEILDDVRDLSADNKVPFTLSIGVASEADSLIELGNWAQASLDMALGRGGDQVAVKSGQRLSFYGGRTNAVEKRTRVRARVISHALRDLIRDSDKVLIMGHKIPDMDAIGAAIGVLKAVQLSGKEGYIVLEGINPSIERLMDVIQEHEKIVKWFITPEEALQMTTLRTLAVVVDTHRFSMVAEPKLLSMAPRIVVVDHHRRGEDFISDAVLVYMEPYASSTCELVTELLQYFHDRITLNAVEATALLAGMTVDTKSFSMRTGARTFEAASFLRRNGADSAMIHRLLKEDLDAYIQKAEIIKHAEILYDHVALAVADKDRQYSQLLIAQVADTLINMTDVKASFVISERPDGLIGISARSLGQMNVQVVMEKLGGGGHLTNAAVQLDGTLEEATAQLKQVLSEIEAEEGLFE